MIDVSDCLDIDIQQVLRNIGYDDNCKLPARISSLIEEYIENIPHLVVPAYTCVIRDINWVHGSTVVIDGPVIFESEVIGWLMKQCEKVAVFLVTIGGHLEETACGLAEDGLILQSAVLDAIGSVAVESVANFVQERVKEIASEGGLDISRRFSPGYCDWEVSQQRVIFGAVNGDYKGIRLTEECLMVPRKSISGIIGVGSCNGNVENYNPCKICAQIECLGRR